MSKSKQSNQLADDFLMRSVLNAVAERTQAPMTAERLGDIKLYLHGKGLEPGKYGLIGAGLELLAEVERLRKVESAAKKLIDVATQNGTHPAEYEQAFSELWHSLGKVE